MKTMKKPGLGKVVTKLLKTRLNLAKDSLICLKESDTLRFAKVKQKTYNQVRIRAILKRNGKELSCKSSI